MNSHKYLRSDVAIELLQNSWYAWSNLLSPATGAMLVANAHIKMMQSFLANPQLHVQALKDPSMRGGPFLDYDATRAGEIRSLLERTEKEQVHLVGFAAAVKTLDRILADEAGGTSLHPLYAKVPNELRGFVELVYDREHHAQARFIEGLLYRSAYYDTRSQSAILSTVGDTQRPFVFTTPRLPRPGDVGVSLPFVSEAFDELYRARTTPQSVSGLAERLQIDAADSDRFASLFTDKPPQPATLAEPGRVTIRYFGHASVLVESDGVNLLIDPIIAHEYPGADHYAHADLPPVIDYVLITHNHQDHCLLEPMLELRHRVRTVIVPRSRGGTLVDPSFRRVLETIGFKHVIEIDELENIPIQGGAITGVPFFGEHADLDVISKIAYHLRIGDHTLMFMADSNNIEPRLYEHVHRILGNVDIIFIGMECAGAPMSFLYGPMFTKPLTRKIDQSRRLDGSNFERARDIVHRFAAKQVYVYAMGQEPWLSHLMAMPYTEGAVQIVESNKLIEECRARKIIAERPYCKMKLVL